MAGNKHSSLLSELAHTPEGEQCKVCDFSYFSSFQYKHELENAAAMPVPAEFQKGLTADSLFDFPVPTPTCFIQIITVGKRAKIIAFMIISRRFVEPRS